MSPKETIHKELEEKIEKYMAMYGTCSQAGFRALNEQFELNADDTIRALKPFAGGPAGQGETCGAVTGVLLALGLYFEPDEINQDPFSAKYAAVFINGIKEEFGSTRCWGIQDHQFGRHYDFYQPGEFELFLQAAQSGKCTEVAKKAALIACDIILERAIKISSSKKDLHYDTTGNKPL